MEDQDSNSNNDTPVTVTPSMPSTSKGPTGTKRKALADCILKYDRYFKTDCPEFSEGSDFLSCSAGTARKKSKCAIEVGLI